LSMAGHVVVNLTSGSGTRAGDCGRPGVVGLHGGEHFPSVAELDASLIQLRAATAYSCFESAGAGALVE
jgi:hypothetical protein